ncbi:hypothetical protein V492_05569 [Pseudogymnoascus sp. VKM F-4246]|nr:hypothetical protein V492_05569 [Pseudogymnoascus sp. VKM F-4246]
MSYACTGKCTRLVPALLVGEQVLCTTVRTVNENELPSRAVVSSYTAEVPARKGSLPACATGINSELRLELGERPHAPVLLPKQLSTTISTIVSPSSSRHSVLTSRHLPLFPPTSGKLERPFGLRLSPDKAARRTGSKRRFARRQTPSRVAGEGIDCVSAESTGNKPALPLQTFDSEASLFIVCRLDSSGTSPSIADLGIRFFERSSPGANTDLPTP